MRALSDWCGGINPYTLIVLYGPHHQRWLGPQDEDVRRTTGQRTPQGYKILYQIGYFACNSVPSGYIRRGRGPLEDTSHHNLVAEPLKCLGPLTPAIVPRTSDGGAGSPPTLEVR